MCSKKSVYKCFNKRTIVYNSLQFKYAYSEEQFLKFGFAATSALQPICGNIFCKNYEKIIKRKIISNLIKIKKMAGFYAFLEILFKNSRSKKIMIIQF